MSNATAVCGGGTTGRELGPLRVQMGACPVKLRLTLQLARGEPHDVTLACDVTATVADAARALIRAGVSGDTALEETVEHRRAPVTLRAQSGRGERPWLLDPEAALGSSGLRSGWMIEAIAESGRHSQGERVVPVAGYVEVLSGAQAGASYSLIAGSCVIGREPGCRVFLGDASVSRRHIAVDVGPQIVLHELGSANGMVVDGQEVAAHVVVRPCTIDLGEVQLRITPGPPAAHSPARSHRVLHTRSPRVAPRFSKSERELPSPPEPAAPGRIPMLAMLAPMMLGGVMFAVTRSPMSLMMVAFSPLMMIGSWLDGKLGGKRTLRRELLRFEQSLEAERAELETLREREITMRSAETPSLVEVEAAIESRDSLLWTRRPEHRSFLELRFGESTLPSRTALSLPARGNVAREQWEVLCRLEREFGEVAPVPVLERLDRCGSIGVAGEAHWGEGLARSLIMQLVGLHSPAELTLVCFAGPRQTDEWAWLKWLPHVDPVTSPLPDGQLAADPARSARLMTALEGLLEARTRGHGARGALPAVPVVLVIVLDDGQVDQSRLIALAEDGPDVGIHLLWVSRSVATLPAACRTFVELGQATGSVHFVRTGTIVPLQRLECLEAPAALRLARGLTPVEDTAARALDESDLPKSVHLRELHATDLLGGAQPIVRAWTHSGSLNARWQAGSERDQVALAAVVGQGPDGAVSIDLRVHGPHALVGGTTGAGKSEFLQTWIMSLAARVSPDRMTFLLIDYKGGAAFAECTELPHTVGLVTDLSPHLVHRALTSLRAELRYREELLAQHGAKDLITMERRSDTAAPPVLIIVIDEFAALASEIPEFVDGIIDVAQRGRSLGLHLIMATQRPAGVIKDNLRANTNLRVALRMADEADSSDVIGVKDAAYFDAETPGRGAIKIGPGKMSHFQTGYLGGRATAPMRGASIELRSLPFAEGEAWDIPPEPRSARPARATPLRDIEQLRDGVIAAASALGLVAPRRPWLAPLPKMLDLTALRRREAPGRAPCVARDAVVIGLRDDPAAQAQPPVSIDLETSGNIAIVGAGGTGKTSALVTLTAALSEATRDHPVQIYAIDAGGGALDAITVLPTVGAVAPLSDSELVGRTLRTLRELIAERGPRYGAVRASGLAAYRASPGRAREPRVVLLIDGFAAFRQATESQGVAAGPGAAAGLGSAATPFQMLSDIMTNGRAVGVHVVLSADRASAIPGAMMSSVQQQFVLRLASPHDYAHLGVAADVLDEAPPGRALLAGADDEVQIAVAGGRPTLASQAEALEALAAVLREGGVAQVPEVRNAPTVVSLSELPVEQTGRPVYGLDTHTFAPMTLPVSGLGVIAGPTGAGLSTAALSCAEAVRRWAAARGEEIERVLLTHLPEGLQRSASWDRVACGEDAVRELAEELVVALGGKPATTLSLFGSAPVGDAAATPQVFPRSGARGVIVVERSLDAEGTSAMPALVALAKAARRADVLVLFEFELGAGGACWELFSAIKQPRWGLTLQPDTGESQSPFREPLGRVQRADFPPGRGFALENGRVAPVHVAMDGAERRRGNESYRTHG